MIFYSLSEILLITLAAMLLDGLIGDPRRLPHPVTGMGRMIHCLEKHLLPGKRKRRNGVLLTVIVTSVCFGITLALTSLAAWLHPLLGYAASAWLISTTIAVRGLREAACEVYEPLRQGKLADARQAVSRIVGRDTAHLNEAGVSRAAVETVAENTVDAFVSPLVYALLGGAPLAMLYRAANTLDSMVGYRNERYLEFGWASARWDDVMNWIPARITGLMLIILAAGKKTTSCRQAWKAIWQFAHLHPSPNSGIPEAAVAGALGIELGGRHTYGGVMSARARLGWPNRPVRADDIVETVSLLTRLSWLIAGGLGCMWFLFVGW
ncbi:adenosylcobinamide-phosphate synthase CbiB [Marinicrinis sediminis]|uniref:Cobalamin biosynthesis protein CobD n=1 Tax=Marinicrinis sediminis TaxID=1652465 RepID=A0ABW5R6B7_9BACL